jgi:prepilin signal peptidase PulO-like enzyme (type II secretory pathway)
MNLFLEMMIFILGLMVGSFINMAVWRLGHNKSFFKEQRSYCDFCKKKLRWYDNIPIFSWLVYGGKSRCCRKKLPLSYPIVELLMGVLFLFNFLNRDNNILIYGIDFLILGILMFEAAFDFKYMMLPDATAYSLIILAGIQWVVMGMPRDYLISALVSGIFIYILHKIKIKGHEAMGDGDILVAVFMGLYLGFPNIIVAFYVAFIVGAIVGSVLILRKKIKRLSPIPFGPFLILGTLVAKWWGEKIINIIF